MLGKYADLYRALYASHGHLPQDVDAMEVWQAASALGVQADPLGGRDLTAERLAAARGKGPRPEVPKGGPVPPTLLRSDRRVG